MIYPGAVWRPGVNAGYRAGRTPMTTAVAHYTVGKDSRPVGDKGFFNFLVSRDGTVTQFAEADAKTWHAGEPWNSRGPGIEIEYLDEDAIFTDAQHGACAALIAWLPIAQQFYDGPRIGTWVGYITHRSLIQTGDAHFDYWSQEDWDAMTKPAEDADMISLLVKKAGDANVYVYDSAAGTKTRVKNGDVLDAMKFLAGRTKLDPEILTVDAKFLDGLPEIKATPDPVAAGAEGGPLKLVLSGTATPA